MATPDSTTASLGCLSINGQGKRGGVRVIYYWDTPTHAFYMLYVYTKQEQGDLTLQQVKMLSRLVKEEFK